MQLATGSASIEPPFVALAAEPDVSTWVRDIMTIAKALCEAEGQDWDRAANPDKDRWGRTAGLAMVRLQDVRLV